MVVRITHVAFLGSVVACGAPHGETRARPAATSVAPDAGGSLTATEPQPTDGADAGVEAVAEVPMEWGTTATGSGPLYALADGMCVNAQIFPVEGGAIFTYGNGEYINYETSNPTLITTAYAGESGIAPQSGRGFGPALDGKGVVLGSIGGAYPDHLFALLDYPTRAAYMRQLRVGTSRPTGWRSVLGSSFADLDVVNMNTVFVAVADPIRWSDGEYLFATSSKGINGGMPQDIAPTYGFRLLLADGTLAPKANLPGADLGEAGFQGGARRALARLANGEVVGVGWDEKKKLVRWSPTKPVDDVPFPIKPNTAAVFRGGKKRAVVALDDALYVYEGDALTPAKLNAKLVKGFSWTIGADDEIIVIQPNGAVIEESTTGALREEKLPFAATFAGVQSGIPWGLAVGKGRHGSDVLVRKNANRWEVVELPPPPFGKDGAAPLKISAIVARDASDVFVIAHRMEAGHGWKRPASFRTLYRTKRPREAVRCQDAPHAWTGSGMHRWAPAADDTCKTPVVVATFGAGLAKGYPTTIGASLRGKTQLGDTLSFVTFEGRGTTNLGVVMTDMAKAKALATHLSLLELRPEVSCGKPAPVRSFTLDVATGAFSPAPAAPK